MEVEYCRESAEKSANIKETQVEDYQNVDFKLVTKKNTGTLDKNLATFSLILELY